RRAALRSLHAAPHRGCAGHDSGAICDRELVLCVVGVSRRDVDAARRLNDGAGPCADVSTGENGGRGDLGHAELQLDWDAGNLESRWPAGLDTAYLLIRVAALPSDVTAEGGPGRVLEVAA